MSGSETINDYTSMNNDYKLKHSSFENTGKSNNNSLISYSLFVVDVDDNFKETYEILKNFRELENDNKVIIKNIRDDISIYEYYNIEEDSAILVSDKIYLYNIFNINIIVIENYVENTFHSKFNELKILKSFQINAITTKLDLKSIDYNNFNPVSTFHDINDIELLFENTIEDESYLTSSYKIYFSSTKANLIINENIDNYANVNLTYNVITLFALSLAYFSKLDLFLKLTQSGYSDFVSEMEKNRKKQKSIFSFLFKLNKTGEKLINLREEIYSFDLNYFYFNPINMKNNKSYELWNQINEKYKINKYHDEVKAQIIDLVGIVNNRLNETSMENNTKFQKFISIFGLTISILGILYTFFG